MNKITEEIKRLEALKEVLEYAEGRVKGYNLDAESYLADVTDEDGNVNEESWQYRTSKEYEEKAEAMKDLITKLEKLI